MILKSPMEDKQLNFNQPLLSVRRGSSSTAAPEFNTRKTSNYPPNLPPLPYYTSDLKSGPVRNPGAIPFQWEQTPGKPKNESKEERQTPEQLPLAPKLPPARFASYKQKSTDKLPKDSPSSSFRSQGENNSASSSSSELSSINKVLSELEVEKKHKESEPSSSSEDENVNYEDARDTLSRSESFFFNCSLSGVSGLEGANENSSGAFLDPKIRDFMMGRFLPAAKAVASEMPQFICKKHPVAREQPEPVKKVVKNKESPICYDVHNVSFHNIHEEGECVEEEEDDDEGDYGHEDLSVRLCGLLPSFCLLNPIPGMRDHAQLIPQIRSEQTKPVSRGTKFKNENKSQIGTHRGETTRITWHNGHTRKSTPNGHFGLKTLTLPKDTGSFGLPEDRDLRVKVDIQKKGFTRLRELLADENADGITKLDNPIVERTLYVDSEQKSESRNSNSSSSESRGRTPSVDYSLQDEKDISQPKDSENSSQDVGQGLVEYLRKDEDLSLVVKENAKDHLPLVLAPFLPKSPSESWLSRTLPAISLKHPTSKTYHRKIQPVDFSKQGRMLRTSNNQLLFQSPMELAPILET